VQLAGSYYESRGDFVRFQQTLFSAFDRRANKERARKMAYVSPSPLVPEMPTLGICPAKEAINKVKGPSISLYPDFAAKEFKHRAQPPPIGCDWPMQPVEAAPVSPPSRFELEHEYEWVKNAILQVQSITLS
jgi:hypothetical protein